MRETWTVGRPLNIAVGGPQGVGKSTVLQLLHRQHPAFEVVSVGDLLPASFKALSVADRAHARAGASQVVLQRLTDRAGGVVFVDLHYLDMDESDPYIQPRELLERFTHHVLLVASPSTIQRRRRRDRQRSNRSLELGDVERDVHAYTDYFRQAAFSNTLVLDCQARPATVVADLVQHVCLWRRGPATNRPESPSLTPDDPRHEDRAHRA